MRGKRARELRKAARMILGPDAQRVHYVMGPTNRWIELSPECEKGFTKRLKKNYKEYRKKTKKSLDIIRKLDSSLPNP
jgi:hypothetical protein